MKQTRGHTTDEILATGRRLAYAARSGRPLKSLLTATFALVREAARRVRNEEHFPVQVGGGLALANERIAEMKTGEGKTLTATLPAALYAFAGKGCHVMTVNDYLAKRDAEMMGPIYEMLGLTVGCLQLDQQPGSEERRAQYHCDVTYGTAQEFGFDLLRDRLGVVTEGSAYSPVQREPFFALVDEADSVMLDEARTPLILSLPRPADPTEHALLAFAQSCGVQLESPRDYLPEPERRSFVLTKQGCRRVMLISRPPELRSIGSDRLFKAVEQALAAAHALKGERDYLVVPGDERDEVVIVDPSTGRPMEGRQWSEGLHQAVEFKEGLTPTPVNGEAARITIISLLRRYPHLAGMTGTAAAARGEFRRLYRRSVRVIPTNRPCIRSQWPSRVFSTLFAKWDAVTAETIEVARQGRAVLIGTVAVAASEELGRRLTEAGLTHRVLNAKRLPEEADIVAQAGQPGAITVSTNMAGRGTDIQLHPSVAEKGGLHVIATEVHPAARIDWQLIGRAARQGDPGSCRLFVSLEDDLLKGVPLHRHRELPDRLLAKDSELPQSFLKLFWRAQAIHERQHRRDRRRQLKAEKQKLEAARDTGLDPYAEYVSSE